jgi:hypothetical protein
MAGSGEGDLKARILAALPGTMRQIVERVGAPDREVWATVSAMRQAGEVMRRPGADGGDRVFSLPAPPPPPEPAEEAPEEADEEKNRKTQQVILVAIKDWPQAQPGRPMVYDVRKSAPKAYRAVLRLRERFPDPDLQWWHEPLTQARIRDLQQRVNSKTLRDVMARRGMVGPAS